MAKEKRQYTLWYYSATALDNFGSIEEVELEETLQSQKQHNLMYSTLQYLRTHLQVSQ